MKMGSSEDATNPQHKPDFLSMPDEELWLWPSNNLEVCLTHNGLLITHPKEWSDEVERRKGTMRQSGKQMIESSTSNTVNPNLKLTRMSTIYFVQAGDGGLIKIGIADNVVRRMTTIQSMCPQRLRLLATMPGSMQDEEALHNRFLQDRLHGEWFTPSPELMDFIKEIVHGRQ